MSWGKTPEGEVKDALKKIIKERGIYAFWPVQMGYGARTVDCLMCYRGLFIGMEVKKDDGKPPRPDPRQETILDAMSGAGAYGLVVNRPDQLTVFLNWIDAQL